jgi:hypothetical protein
MLMYPYEEWAKSGNPWRCQKGTDYKCSTGSFRASLSRYAARHGYTMRTSVEKKDGKEFLVFQFSAKTSTKPVTAEKKK